MIRIVIENLLLLLLPTIIYFSYVFLTRGKTTTGRQALTDAPLLWLFVAGVMCSMVAIVFFISKSGGAPGDRYVPSVYKDGEVIPGYIEKQKPKE